MDSSPGKLRNTRDGHALGDDHTAQNSHGECTYSRHSYQMLHGGKTWQHIHTDMTTG